MAQSALKNRFLVAGVGRRLEGVRHGAAPQQEERSRDVVDGAAFGVLGCFRRRQGSLDHLPQGPILVVRNNNTTLIASAFATFSTMDSYLVELKNGPFRTIPSSDQKSSRVAE